MRAMLVDEDQSLRWAEVPDPTLKETDVLVEVHAAAVNRADLLQRAGKYPPPPGAPEWMGLEVAGIIRQLGAGVSTSHWNVGDRVCALLPGGGYAEQVTVNQQLLMPVPAGLSMAEAATLPEVFATAWINLVDEADVQPGETVLIHAGASGVGIAAIQIAQYLGARVITTVGGSAKVKAISHLGAAHIVDHQATDITTVFDECEANGQPVNVALDCVGGAQLGTHLTKLAPGGRWVLIATLGGTSTELSLRPVLKKGLKLIGSTLRGRSNTVKGHTLHALTQRIWPEIEAGRIRPVVHRILPIKDAEAAHQILEQRRNIGKVALLVRE